MPPPPRNRSSDSECEIKLGVINNLFTVVVIYLGVNLNKFAEFKRNFAILFFSPSLFLYWVLVPGLFHPAWKKPIP